MAKREFPINELPAVGGVMYKLLMALDIKRSLLTTELYDKITGDNLTRTALDWNLRELRYRGLAAPLDLSRRKYRRWRLTEKGEHARKILLNERPDD